jgi:hypothetical protein
MLLLLEGKAGEASESPNQAILIYKSRQLERKGASFPFML